MKLAIISDICGNMVALQAFLTEASRHQVKHIFCAGNVIGYGPHSRECWELAMKRRFIVTRGEMEHLVGYGTFAGPMSEHLHKMLLLTMAQFNPETRSLMCKMTMIKHIPIITGYVLVMGHSTLADSTGGRRINDTISIHSELDLLQSFYANANILILGNNTFPIFMSSRGTYVERNCHQFCQIFHMAKGRRYLINPGSIGRPIDGEKPDKDGCLHFTYAILTIETSGINVTYYRTKYEPKEHVKEMRHKGFPEVFIQQFTK